MSDEHHASFGFTADPAPLDKLVEALKRYNIAVAGQISIARKYNATAKSWTTTVTGQTTALEKFRVRLAETTRGYALIDRVIKKNTRTVTAAEEQKTLAVLRGTKKRMQQLKQEQEHFQSIRRHIQGQIATGRRARALRSAIFDQEFAAERFRQHTAGRQEYFSDLGNRRPGVPASAATRALLAQEQQIQKTTKAQRELTNATQEYLISWRSIGRLVVIQLLHRALAAMSRAMLQGAQDAIRLTKAIAEIQTISQSAQMNVSKWVISLRQVSEAYGLDVLDAAEAAYQAVSNQIVRGAETTAFMADAAKFATVTVSSLTESVQLLAGALNAYGRPAADAKDVSAKFFKIIELGRVRSSEMANSLGNIEVMAKQLNISMEDLGAMITLLTIKGIKFNQAATQMRGIFSKLLKPTKEMTALFRDLGVTSGETAIKTFGLAGFMQRAGESTNFMASNMAKLIPRIRGLSGALIYSREGVAQHIANLHKIQNANDSYAKAAAMTLQNAGKSIEIEMAKIRNFFLIDIGVDLIRALAKATGGFDGFAETVKRGARIIMLVGTVAISVLSAKLLMMAGTIPGAIAVGVGAIAAIFEAAMFGAERYHKNVMRQLDVQMRKYEALRDTAAKSFRAVNAAGDAAINDLAKNVRLQTAAAAAKFNRMADSAVEAYAAASLAIKRSMDSANNAVSKMASDAQAKLRAVEQAIKATKDKILDEGQAASNRRFDKANKGKTVQQLRDAYNKRIAGLAKKAQQSSDPDIVQRQIAEAVRLTKAFQLVIDKYNELQAANKQKNRRIDTDLARKALAIKNEIKQLDTARDEFIKALNRRLLRGANRQMLEQELAQYDRAYNKKRQALEAQSAQARTRAGQKKQPVQQQQTLTLDKTAVELLQTQLRLLERIKNVRAQIAKDAESKKALIDFLKDKYSKFDPKKAFTGDVKDQQTAAKDQIDTIDALIKKYQELGLAQGGSDLKKYLDAQKKAVQDQLKAVEGAADARKIEAIQLAAIERVKTLRKEAQEAVKAQESQLARIAKIFQEISQALAPANGKGGARVTKIAKMIDGLTDAMARGSKQDIQKYLKQLNDAAPAIKKLWAFAQDFQDNGGLRKSVANVIFKGLPEATTALKNLLTLLQGTETEDNFIVQAQKDLENAKKVIADSNAALKDTHDNMGVAVGDLAGKMNALRDAVREMFRALVAPKKTLLKMSAVSDAAKKSANAASQEAAAHHATNIQLAAFTNAAPSVIQQSNAVAGAIRNEAAAAREAAAAFRGLNNVRGAGGAVGVAQQGGMPVNYMATGGLPYGHDSVMTMLDPREFVMPASQTQQFYGTLAAMRSHVSNLTGSAPVTHINGDFNISVNSKGNSQIDAVQIGKALRRSIRQGRVRLS